jgi:phosphocarrier protein
MSASMDDHPPVARTVTIKSPLGLHARPAALFVRTASQFQSRVVVCKGRQRASGKSIMEILTLAANRGAKVRIEARGVDATQAVRVLGDLLDAEVTSEAAGTSA